MHIADREFYQRGGDPFRRDLDRERVGARIEWSHVQEPGNLEAFCQFLELPVQEGMQIRTDTQTNTFPQRESLSAACPRTFGKGSIHDDCHVRT